MPAKVIERDTFIGAYDLTGRQAIVEHPEHGRLFVTEGYGGEQSLCGGGYRWRHGYVMKVDRDATLKDSAALFNAGDLDPLPWHGHHIQNMMEAAVE